MKQRLIHILTIIGVICITACTREGIELPSAEQTSVTFLLNRGSDAVTRAISDGTSVDKLIYAVYNDKGQIILPRAEQHSPAIVADKVTKERSLSLTISVPAGSNYKAVFWLQSSECDAYTISDDMQLTVDYSGVGNDEHRDAFWGVTDPFDVDGSVVELTLKRPFAQVNAGTFPFDWEYAQRFHNFNATTSSTLIAGVANRMNLLSGEVSGSVNTTFTPGALPTETLLTDVDGDGTDEEYTYLSMSYILAADESTTHSASFFYLNDEGKTVSFSDARTESIILQRNHRTDVVGQVLSDNGSLNIRDYVNTGNGGHPDAPNYVYYNVSEDTTLSNTVYNLDDYDAGMQFASTSGQMITMENTYFTGNIWVIELGEYRKGGYVNYNNTLNNVVLKDLSVSAHIDCHEWYFSPAVIAYGNTVLNNCTMTGTTTVATTHYDGKEYDFIPVDLGVRNESDAVVNGGTYGTVFAWTHAVVTLNNTSIGTLYCGTCDSTNHSQMTINAGTTIDKVICCEPRCPYGNKEYSTRMIIRKGAKIGSLQLVSTDVEFLLIEEGAEVGPITCEGVEYTYKELREAMGLSYPVVFNN